MIIFAYTLLSHTTKGIKFHQRNVTRSVKSYTYIDSIWFVGIYAVYTVTLTATFILIAAKMSLAYLFVPAAMEETF